MSYTDQMIDHQLAVAADIATPADPIANARHFPGYQPILVRAIWAVITTATTVAVTLLTFKFRPTPGSASGELTIGTLTIPSGAAIGSNFFKEVTPFKVPPGGEVVVQTDGGATAGNATVGITQQPCWEHPSNNPDMIASA